MLVFFIQVIYKICNFVWIAIHQWQYKAKYILNFFYPKKLFFFN